MIISDLRKLTRPLAVLLAGIFMVNFGSFLIIPYIAIYVIHYLGLSILFASTYLSINFTCQRAFSLFGGIVADRVGPKLTLLLGLIFRSLAYSMLALTQHKTYLIISALAMGLGSAFYSPACKVLLLALSDKTDRAFILSLRAIAMNIGVSLGPLVGVAVLYTAPMFIFILCIVLYTIVFVMLVIFVPGAKVNTRISRKAYWRAYKLLLKPRIQGIGLMMAFFMFGYMQIELTIPLFIRSLTGQIGVSIFFTLNALMCIFIALPLIRYLARININFNLLMSFLLMGVAFMLCAIIFSKLILLMAAIMFTLAEIIFFPMLDSKLYACVPEVISGATFGINDLAASFGGILGILLGGRLYHVLLTYYGEVNYYWGYLGLAFGLFSVVVYCFMYAHKLVTLGWFRSLLKR